MLKGRIIMKHVKVTVEGYGTFEINIEKIRELMNWLSQNQAVSIRQDNQIREVKDNQYTGRVLLRENS